MIALSNHTRIFVCAAPTDLRKGFDGLSGLVAECFPVELLSGHLFLFFNRSRDRIKVLYWDHDGLALWYKRLEAGTYQLPNAWSSNDASSNDASSNDAPTNDASSNNTPTNHTLEIDHTQLALLLAGIDWRSVQRRKRYRVA